MDVDNVIDRHEWMDDDEERMHRSIEKCVMGQWRSVREYREIVASDILVVATHHK